MRVQYLCESQPLWQMHYRHDTASLPAQGEGVFIDGKRYVVLKRDWFLDRPTSPVTFGGAALLKLSLTDKHEVRESGFVFNCCVCGNEVWEKQELFKRESRVIAEGDEAACNYLDSNNIKSPEAYNAFLAGYIKASDHNPTLVKIIETMKKTKAKARCYEPGNAHAQALADGWVEVWAIVHPIASNKVDP